jgi:uncharacterized cofD-like protein
LIMSNLSIAALGGGTGLSTMLKGLKLHTDKITAIVTVADDGGSSGILRADRGMLPPGDVRNCIAALAEIEPEYGKLLNYRFPDGVFGGHTLGNIMLAAINDLADNFDSAVKRLCRLAGVAGSVVPVSNDLVSLNAVLTDGTVIEGESNIGKRTNTDVGIDRVFLNPSDIKPVNSAVKAIEEADIIILGPGSLYTSIIPNLLVDGITDAIVRSNAKKVYVCNIMTQPGETDGYTAAMHLDAIERHSVKGIVDYIVINDAPLPQSVCDLYAEQNAKPVVPDEENLKRRVGILHGNLFLVKDGQVRHNFSRLARGIISLV